MQLYYDVRSTGRSKISLLTLLPPSGAFSAHSWAPTAAAGEKSRVVLEAVRTTPSHFRNGRWGAAGRSAVVPHCLDG